MPKRDIVVVGASAGGVDALKKLVRGLPADFAASIFIVWHTAPDITSFLPIILDREGELAATTAVDGELIEPGRIYVAQPDYHLLVERGIARVTKGPKENRFRPAVDPLFRSAAYTYSSRVIGIVLSGGLDDGTAGLWTIKHRGGLAIVQDPQEAEAASMPQSAMREVEVDYCVSVLEMPDLLVRLTSEEVEEITGVDMEEDKKTALEVRIAAEENAFENGILELGEPSSLTCPECHGVFFKLKDGNFGRFRCHTGHAYSPDSLLATISEQIEESLWNAIRAVEESVMLLNTTSRQLTEANQTELAELYRQKAREAEARGEQLRRSVISHEQLTADSLRRQVNGK